MTELNHTIVACRNQEQSASFLADVLGRAAPKRWGPFHVVELDNNVSLDYYESAGSICSQHYAFLISEEEFDAVLARVRARDLTYWADPGRNSQTASTTTMADVASTSMIRTDTSWKSSRVPTEVAETWAPRYRSNRLVVFIQ